MWNTVIPRSFGSGRLCELIAHPVKMILSLQFQDCVYQTSQERATSQFFN